MGNPAVAEGATCMCSFGDAPAVLNVLPTGVTVQGRPAAVVTNSTPLNVPTFGMCNSISNPEVAAATAAKFGVLTPMPCVPVLTPWIPLSTTTIQGQPALVAGSTCMCAWGGVIEIVMPGTEGVLI
jgi:uncharacterized Zn-binding protein involved in type VI secretion